MNKMHAWKSMNGMPMAVAQQAYKIIRPDVEPLALGSRSLYRLLSGLPMKAKEPTEISSRLQLPAMRPRGTTCIGLAKLIPARLNT